MVLNYIWVGFFIIAFIVGLFQWIVMGNVDVFPEMVQSTFDMSKLSFEISIGLTGVMCFWMGFMKIGEKGGLVAVMSRLVGPFFKRLFPEVPEGHPAVGSMVMNFSANMMGLDNAATPLGLNAMKQLQELNPNKETASNAQIMFLVLNTSGLTLLPINVMVYRSQMGAVDPSDVFIPILLATFFSTMVGLVAVSFFQKLKWDKVVWGYLLGLSAFVLSLLALFMNLDPETSKMVSKVSSNVILFSIIVSFLIMGLRKKINLYESFIEGAKDGFGIAITIIPYLVAILVGIGVFRASGAMDLFIDAIKYVVVLVGLPTDFVEALPTAFMKPLSGSGARGAMVDAMEIHGADSFVGRLASTFQGSTDTTFYVLAVYFGSVGIKNIRYALQAGLIADFAGIIAAIFIAYLFFGHTIGL